MSHPGWVVENTESFRICFVEWFCQLTVIHFEQDMDVIYELNENHIKELHELYQSEWWTKGRTLEETRKCVNASQVCIGLIDLGGMLKGFTRVLTDFTFKALIFDVIVAAEFRGRGYGDELIKLVKSHALLRSVKCFELYCLPELEGFYEMHGFSSDVGGISLMRLKNV